MPDCAWRFATGEGAIVAVNAITPKPDTAANDAEPTIEWAQVHQHADSASGSARNTRTVGPLELGYVGQLVAIEIGDQQRFVAPLARRLHGRLSLRRKREQRPIARPAVR